MPLVDDEIMSHLEARGGTALADRYAQQVRGPFDTAVFQADRSAPDVLDRWASMPSWSSPRRRRCSAPASWRGPA